MAMNYAQMQALNSMFSTEEDENRREQSKENAKVAYGFGKSDQGGVDPNFKTELKVGKEKSIWSEEEIKAAEESKFEAVDQRKCPEHEFIYKQAVSSEDVFLGMSGNDPSSRSCNKLVVRVILPGAVLRDITLDVTENRLLLCSSQYYLSTHLPQVVDPKSVNAKWDGSKFTLSVTLNIVRQEE